MPPSAFFFTLPAITRQTSIALFSSVSSTHALSWAFPLVAVVKIPVPPVTLNPCLIMLQTLHCGIELHKLEDPFRPREHAKEVQWNLSSSLPSAMQRGCFLGSFVALAFMESLYSSNLVMVFWVLWTLRMRSILHTGDCFFSQLEWNIISTMFLLVSSGPSSETEIGNRKKKKMIKLQTHQRVNSEVYINKHTSYQRCLD